MRILNYVLRFANFKKKFKKKINYKNLKLNLILFLKAKTNERFFHLKKILEAKN